MPKRPVRRRNTAGLLDTFIAGLSGSVGGALGSAVETLVISAGAVAVDRLLNKRSPGTPPQATLAAPAITSPESLDYFLRNHSQTATVIAQLPITQMGTIPATGAHEVVYQLVTGHRLAVRHLPDGQITFKQLGPQAKPAPATGYTPPTQTALPKDELPIIDCEPNKEGVYEPR